MRDLLRVAEKLAQLHDAERRRSLERYPDCRASKNIADSRSTPDCRCKGLRWVCEDHPAIALDQCPCGAAALPCDCNPDARPPPRYESMLSTPDIGNSRH